MTKKALTVPFLVWYNSSIGGYDMKNVKNIVLEQLVGAVAIITGLIILGLLTTWIESM